VRTADGRRWELVTDDTSVTAVMPGGTVAEARVSEPDERVVVEFWAEPADLPRDLVEALVGEAFAAPAVRRRRPVVVCVPQRHGTVLAQARRFVVDGSVRSAGVTCLLEGRVGGAVVPAARRPSA
jgi:hypothetical protein